MKIFINLFRKQGDKNERARMLENKKMILSNMITAQAVIGQGGIKLR